MTLILLFETLKGGPGSGHHGHRGIPGKRGGSASVGGAAVVTPPPTPKPPEPAKVEPPKKDPYAIPINPKTEIKAQKHAITHFGSKEAADKALRDLKEYLKDAPVCMRVPAEVFSKILDEGRFKNQHETGTSRGTLSPRLRAEAERKAFGKDLSKPEEFPIYGYFATGKNGFSPYADGYGGMKIELKPEVRKRTTVTVGDSLSGFHSGVLTGTPSNHPRIASLDTPYERGSSTTKMVPQSYLEAQIHGPLRPRDIAKVYIQGRKGGRSKGVTDRLDKMGIPYEFVAEITD